MDIRGRVVRRLFAGSQLAGYQAVPWDGKTETGGRAASGVYYAVVKAGKQADTARLTLVKQGPL